MNLLFDMRSEFFNAIAAAEGTVLDAKQVVLTHFLPDRPELVEAFHRVIPVAALIAIPYSIVPEVLEELRKTYKVFTPTLDQLRDKAFMLTLLRQVFQENPGVRIALNEIGGYFAPFLNEIHSEFGERIVGCVEDTQNGHVRYENARPLPYPVVSVARSALKEGEDTLVGPSCYFSADRLLRSLGVLLAPRRALIVGYGKVGRGTAFALQDSGCTSMVYDINPIRNCVAHGDGMLIPDRAAALKGCDIIFGCTGVTSIGGPDFDSLDDGCFLVSCSSKDVEFDLKALSQQFTLEPVAPSIDRYRSKQTGKILYLLGKGTPINFLDGAVFGPALTLVQAELIVASRYLFNLATTGELTEVDTQRRKAIAGAWQAKFIDPMSGSFPY